MEFLLDIGVGHSSAAPIAKVAMTATNPIKNKQLPGVPALDHY